MGKTSRVLIETRMGFVHAVSSGSSGGTPLVLLHQTPRSADEYAEILPLLGAHRRVVAFDTPGYGCSDPVPGKPRIEDYAFAIRQALAALGIERAIVCGHHTGAVVAIEMAAAYPGIVDRAVLSGAIFLDDVARAAMRPYFVQWRVHPDGSHLTEKWRALARWTPDTQLLHRAATDQFRAGEASEQGHFAVLNYDMSARLPLVRCPALFLFHQNDPFTDEARARPIIDAFSPAEIARTAGGIFAPNETPDAFAQAILDYLSN